LLSDEREFFMKPEKKYGLLVADQGNICHVTINRAGDRNSINSDLMTALVETLADIEKTTARAVIFSGCGKTHFIGGADGVEMMRCDPTGAMVFSERIQALFNRMEQSPLILLAAINGLCFGGGFEFAMACDLRVAAQSARIGLPEVKVGIIPGGGGTQRLPHLVGFGVAMEMILSGRLYQAEEACRMGLVHYAVPADQLLVKAHAVLEPILRNPQHALSQAKQAVHAFRHENFANGLKTEREAFSRCFSEDYFSDLMQQQLDSGMLQTTTRPTGGKL
jgi:enoyl-CoA hydratase